MKTLAFCLALAAATPALQPAFAAPAPAAAESAEVRLPHISIVSAGSGDPVVFIPGLSSPRATWDGIRGQAAGHRFILVQVNGFGGDDPGANLNPGVLDGIAADLHSYLQREKAGPARVVGHSMGGLAALIFAKAHPDDVKSLMIVDSLPFFAVLMDPAASVETVRPAAAMMRDKVASTYGKPVDQAAIEANVRGLSLKPESIALTRQWAAKADPRVTAQALYEDLTTDVRADLASIAAPVTVVVPWTDSAFGKDRTLAFYSRQYAGTPHIRFADIGDAGHFVMLDQPEAFRAALREFLAD